MYSDWYKMEERKMAKIITIVTAKADAGKQQLQKTLATHLLKKVIKCC